jgi:antitoxin ParD1/3/4
MQVDDQLNITLPPEMTKRIREKIAAGYYRNELEVIEDGLDALEPSDAGIERWLIEEVVPAYDAMEKDSSSGLSVDQVRSTLAALHAKASKAG